jgi:hypothetical protein
MFEFVINLFENVHFDSNSVVLTLAIIGLFSPWDPRFQSKINGLCAVETVIEAAVIGIRESDNNLTFFLYYPGDRNIMLG